MLKLCLLLYNYFCYFNAFLFAQAWSSEVPLLISTLLSVATHQLTTFCAPPSYAYSHRFISLWDESSKTDEDILSVTFNSNYANTKMLLTHTHRHTHVHIKHQHSSFSAPFKQQDNKVILGSRSKTHSTPTPPLTVHLHLSVFWCLKTQVLSIIHGDFCDFLHHREKMGVWLCLCFKVCACDYLTDSVQ